jgi:endoglucanase
MEEFKVDIGLFANICAVFGPTGREGRIAEFLLNEVKDYVDEWRVDALGNLIVRKKAEGKKKMMLAAHMDTIGLMATHIEDEGFIRFSPVGGFQPKYLNFQRVVFESGVLGTIACDRLEPNETMTLDKLYIDVGADNKEEAEKVVKIGDTCVYVPIFFEGETIMTPYLDDRVGCYIAVEILKRIQNPAFDIHAVFTVQEEIGLRGAKTSAYSIDPDYGLAFDVTLAFDTPNSRKFPMKKGGGAAIKIKDSSVICDPRVVAHLTKIAEDNNIKHQFEILEAGGTDSGAIHVNASGVPSGVVSVVTRYCHTSVEMCASADIEAAVNLAVAALEKEIVE